MAKLFIPWQLHHWLALQLTLPYSQDNSVIRQLSDELQFTMNSSTFFTAFIVKTKLFLEASTATMADLFQKFQDFLNPYHITCVYLEKKFQYMVYFLFSQTPPSRQILTHAGSFLMEHFAEFGRYSMAREALSNIDQNAASALLEKLLQSFSNNCKFLQNPVKDLYYKLFLCLEDARHQQKIPGSGNPGNCCGNNRQMFYLR